MNLSALAGNGRIKEQLSSAAHLPHAMILSGPAGSGKHTLARLLAQAMICDAPEPPCGVCAACRLIGQDTHPDVVPVERFLSREELGKDLKVDAVRSLRSDAYIRPNQARRKVYLISRADSMNLSAQNALLKVLEDGPEYAAFLLLAENPMNLLETIRSRCVRYELAPVLGREGLDFLRRRFPDREEGELQAALEAADGMLGQAARSLEGEQGEDPQLTRALEELAAALGKKSELALMEWSVRLQNDKLNREQLTRLYQALSDRARDGLTGAPAGAAWAKALSRRQLSQLARLAEQGLQAARGNVSPGHSLGWFAVSAYELLGE